MKLTVLSLAVMCALASPGLAAAPLCVDDHQPPPSARHEPTVPYRVFHIARSEVHRFCSSPRRSDVTACAYPTADPAGDWQILISNDTSAAEYACNLRYEKAHLPPNYWGDPSVETPETMDWLATIKRASVKR